MKYSSVYFIIAVSAALCASSWSQINSDYSLYCTNNPTEDIACYERDLIYCLNIGNDRFGTLLATCPDELYCNADNYGCSWGSPSVTTQAPTPTASTEGPTQVTCKTGELKANSGDCQKYYYCRSNTWIESTCPDRSEFNALQESCVFSLTCGIV